MGRNWENKNGSGGVNRECTRRGNGRIKRVGWGRKCKYQQSQTVEKTRKGGIKRVNKIQITTARRLQSGRFKRKAFVRAKRIDSKKGERN